MNVEHPIEYPNVYCDAYPNAKPEPGYILCEHAERDMDSGKPAPGTVHPATKERLGEVLCKNCEVRVDSMSKDDLGNFISEFCSLACAHSLRDAGWIPQA